MVNLWNPAIYSNGLTPEQQNLLNFDMKSASDDNPNIIVVPVGQQAPQPENIFTTPQAPVSQEKTYMPLVPSVPQVDRRALDALSYSEPTVEDIQGPPTGEEYKEEDPWYLKAAKGILAAGGEFADKLTEKTPTGTVLSDWVNNFAASPFLAMPRNEVFQRMQAQANANLDREAKMGRTGSEAAPLQIYKHFLGENGYGAPDNTPEQNQMLAQDAYAKTMAFLQSSRSNINIGGEPNDKWVNDINKKTYEDVNAAANDSYFLGAMANELVNALEKGDLTTGGGDIGSWGLGTLNKLGLSSEKQQQYSALLSRFSMEQRKALLSSFKGAISNKEQDIITSSIAGLGSSRAENLAFLKLASLSARLAQDAQTKYDELMGMGLTGSALSTAYNNYLKARSDSTAKEVASIMGGVPKRRTAAADKGGSAKVLNMDELE